MKLGEKLSKKEKAAWLKNLKSGEFKQLNTRLREEDKLQSKNMCCLGVLSHTLGDDIVLEGGETCDVDRSPYQLITQGYCNDITKQLYSTNDSGYKRGMRDYSEVIPIIEELETRN